MVIQDGTVVFEVIIRHAEAARGSCDRKNSAKASKRVQAIGGCFTYQLDECLR